MGRRLIIWSHCLCVFLRTLVVTLGKIWMWWLQLWGKVCSIVVRRFLEGFCALVSHICKYYDYLSPGKMVHNLCNHLRRTSRWESLSNYGNVSWSKKRVFTIFCISLNTKIVSFNAMCDAAIRIAFFFFECRRKGLCGGLLSITLNVSKVRETGMISAEKYPAAPYNFFFSVWINLTSNFVFRWPDILSFRAKKF